MKAVNEIKAWLTPSLIIVIGFFLTRTLDDINKNFDDINRKFEMFIPLKQDVALMGRDIKELAGRMDRIETFKYRDQDGIYREKHLFTKPDDITYENLKTSK